MRFAKILFCLALFLPLKSVVLAAPSDSTIVVTTVVGMEKDETGKLVALGMAESTGCSSIDSAFVREAELELEAPPGLSRTAVHGWTTRQIRSIRVARHDFMMCDEVKRLTAPISYADRLEMRNTWSMLTIPPVEWEEGPPSGYFEVMTTAYGEARRFLIAPTAGFATSDVRISLGEDSYTKEAVVHFEIDSEASTHLEAYTSANLGRPVALVVEGVVVTTATISGGTRTLTLPAEGLWDQLQSVLSN